MNRNCVLSASLIFFCSLFQLHAEPNFNRMLQKIQHTNPQTAEREFPFYEVKEVKQEEPESSSEYKPRDFSYLLGMKGFSDHLLNQHFRLYQGYVKNTNLLNKKLDELVDQGKERTPDYAGLKRMYGWEFDGMRLHEYYFENLGGDGQTVDASKLHQAILDQWGSFAKWKQDYIGTGMLRGIGWAILYLDPYSGKLVNVWISEHNLNHLAGGIPILVMDVWEHAYITEYGLDRGEYIDAFFRNIDWNIASKRFDAAK